MPWKRMCMARTGNRHDRCDEYAGNGMLGYCKEHFRDAACECWNQMCEFCGGKCFEKVHSARSGGCCKGCYDWRQPTCTGAADCTARAGKGMRGLCKVHFAEARKACYAGSSQKRTCYGFYVSDLDEAHGHL